VFKYGRSVFQIWTAFIVNESNLKVQVKINFNLPIANCMIYNFTSVKDHCDIAW
jgi:hypothetical protein